MAICGMHTLPTHGASSRRRSGLLLLLLLLGVAIAQLDLLPSSVQFDTTWIGISGHSRQTPLSRWGPKPTSRAASGKPQEEEVSWLDTPILDPNEYGGPFEPLKEFVRDNSDIALGIYGLFSLAFFLVLLKLFGFVSGLVSGG
mmetsp:Transcript_113018/g.225048  ORF Transcript_113018/g.225048 Transcript_113018/m.225048 type:complete len:143 (-) Transcript_113018:57-485(-)